MLVSRSLYFFSRSLYCLGFSISLLHTQTFLTMPTRHLRHHHRRNLLRFSVRYLPLIKLFIFYCSLAQCFPPNCCMLSTYVGFWADMTSILSSGLASPQLSFSYFSFKARCSFSNASILFLMSYISFVVMALM